jgi:hypothetical protein
MLTESVTTPVAPQTGIGQAELADGLMLVRASTLKMLRLQLAMERRDRRFAIETVDELVVLDRCLSECLAAMPLALDQVGLAKELDQERAALNREKLTLAAQVITRNPWIEPAPEPVEPEPVTLEPEPWDADAWEGTLAEQAPRSRRALWLLVGLLLILSAVAVTGFLLGIPPELARLGPDVGGFL